MSNSVNPDGLCGCVAVVLAFALIYMVCQEMHLFDRTSFLPAQSSCGTGVVTARKASPEDVVPVADEAPHDGMKVEDAWLYDESGCKQQAPLQHEEELRGFFHMDGTDDTWTAGDEETERFTKYTLDKDQIRKQVNARSFGISREEPRYTSSIGATTSVAHQLYSGATTKKRSLSKHGICFGGNDQHWEGMRQQNGGVADFGSCSMAEEDEAGFEGASHA